MNKEILLCVELLKNEPDEHFIRRTLKSLDRNEFLLVASAFPVDQLLISAERLRLNALKGKLLQLLAGNMLIRRNFEDLLLKLVRKFNREGIDFILLKGFAFPELVGFRTTSDIDFLVKKDSWKRCLETLNSFGFYAHSKHSLQYYDSFLNEVTLVFKPNPALKVEPHWGIVQPFSPFSINNASLWKHSKLSSIRGHPVRVLCDEHTLIHLSIHALYQPASILPLRDIYVIHKMISTRSINWNFLIREARSWKAHNFVYSALIISKKYFGTPVPQRALDLLRRRGFQLFLIWAFSSLRLRRRRLAAYDSLDFFYEFFLADISGKIGILRRSFYSFTYELGLFHKRDAL
ncbi:MAG: nucleotidyltransferase family protein [Candidatus Woesearchaeota archaeon]